MIKHEMPLSRGTLEERVRALEEALKRLCEELNINGEELLLIINGIKESKK